MRFHVLDASVPDDAARWREAWERWSEREIMAHPEYVRLLADPAHRPVCLLGEGEQGTILFPLVLRPLNVERWAREGEDRWDAVSPYGYGGPFRYGMVSADDEAAFWRAHASWSRDQRLVSTFARLSLFPETLARMPGTVRTCWPNVVRRLDVGMHAIWAEYDRNVRNNVRNAERAGVTVEVDVEGSRLDEFCAVYEHTMRRVGATEWYFFSKAFFAALVERLRGHLAFFHAVHGGHVVSSELVLCSATRTYAFLGGTLADAFRLRPNDLLRHHAIAWSLAHGKQVYVLGGGYQPDDGILRHKRSFAPRGDVPFNVVSLVHDHREYDDLVRQRAHAATREGNPCAGRPDFFPAYRA